MTPPAAIQPSLYLIGRILCLLRGLNCGGAFNRSPLGRSQFTSSRELPDDHLDFQSLRERRPRLGSPARVGTVKLHNHHNHLHNHHSNQLCEVLARSP